MATNICKNTPCTSQFYKLYLLNNNVKSEKEINDFLPTAYSIRKKMPINTERIILLFTSSG